MAHWTLAFASRALAVLMVLSGNYVVSAGAASVKWDTLPPQDDVLSSYGPGHEASLLNFYYYRQGASRRIAQTFSVEAVGEKVEIHSVTLKLGRNVFKDGDPFTVNISFFKIPSPTVRNLNPTVDAPLGSATVELNLAQGEGDGGSYLTIIFDNPIILETDPGTLCSYAFVLAFAKPSANQKLILALGENIPGLRAMQNTDEGGWKYLGENPSLIYHIQGKNSP